MNILGNKVMLRAIEEEDLRQLHAWANDPEIWKGLSGWHFPTNFDSMKQWFSRLKDDQLNHRFAVQVIETGELIGTANLINIDWKNNHAFHGMMLGKVHRGMGYGTDTVMAMMRYVFDELHLERLDGEMIEHNEASIRLYVGNCGWKEEGRLRRWYFRQGRYWDKIVVSVIREDYRALVEKTGYWKTNVAAVAAA